MSQEPQNIDRRNIIKKTVASVAGGSFLINSLEEQTLVAAIESGQTMEIPKVTQHAHFPQGKLGNLTMSRLILGGNLIGGFAHGRDLIYVSKLFRAYNTDEKIYETFRLAESHGINTIVIPFFMMKYIETYNGQMGGHLQTIAQILPGRNKALTDMEHAIHYAMKKGATTMYIEGHVAELLVEQGKIDALAKTVDYIKSQGFVAGIGGHAIEVPIACEKEGLDPDYYVKTLHPDDYWSAHPRENRVPYEVDKAKNPEHDRFHDNMFDLFPEKTIAFMKKVKKPWIAFKVLAAGALHPNVGFKYAFENGADFICVGMFDFQIAEDVKIAKEVLASKYKRARAWYS